MAASVPMARTPAVGGRRAVVAAGSAFHRVHAPDAVGCGVFLVSADDGDQLADAADELAGLAAGDLTDDLAAADLAGDLAAVVGESDRRIGDAAGARSGKEHGSWPAAELDGRAAAEPDGRAAAERGGGTGAEHRGTGGEHRGTAEHQQAAE